MRESFVRKTVVAGLAVVVTLTLTASPLWAQGTFLRGVGAVNESMGGATVAAPIDAAGAIYWNPAAISGLSTNMMSIDLGVIIPKTSVASQVVGAPNTYGIALSEAGEIPAPTMAMVWRPKNMSRVTTGLFVGAVGGAAAVYAPPAAVNINPILGGVAKASNVQVLQVIPTVSYQVSDRVSVGFSPVVALAQANINPMVLGMPAGTHMENYGSAYTWGGGFNTGIYYEINDKWRTGVSLKSPVWAEPLKFVGTSGGVPVRSSMPLDLPLILSLGLSYDGFRDTTIAADVRFFNWDATKGFGGAIVQNGRVMSLGWQDSMSVALGVQRHINTRLSARLGYTYSNNPIPSESQFANVGSPLFVEHVLAMGGTFVIVKGLELNAAYAHAFKNSESGTVGTMLGQTPATIKVTNTAYANTLVAGVTKKW